MIKNFRTRFFNFKDRLKVFLKRKFFQSIFIFVSKLIAVLFASLVLFAVLSMFKAIEYSWVNYCSCVALYFCIEEIKPYLLKLRGKK